MTTQDSYFMQLAVDLAKKAAKQDEVPVGAIITENNKVIASSHNEKELFCDPTKH